MSKPNAPTYTSCSLMGVVKCKVSGSTCPDTVFVLGGYSQGASVIDISIGIQTMLGSGNTIPNSLSSRIMAIVTFGNPLKLFGQTIKSAISTYGSRAIEFCNLGDPVTPSREFLCMEVELLSVVAVCSNAFESNDSWVTGSFRFRSSDDISGGLSGGVSRAAV
ncbi:hypothetical protein JM18_005603 [Phytophthora kernoviae]|uniref:Cutinase n=1 Tax=Phytophthora kernoviae TaxID=325452 RepID=A0A921SGP5_9STRA|nr:hypothetical protein JM18_005603 [Phytophthora kernoviae]